MQNIDQAAASLDLASINVQDPLPEVKVSFYVIAGLRRSCCARDVIAGLRRSCCAGHLTAGLRRSCCAWHTGLALSQFPPMHPALEVVQILLTAIEVHLAHHTVDTPCCGHAVS